MNFWQAYRAARELGPITAVQRAWHLLRIRSGWLERRDASGRFGPDELRTHLLPGHSIPAMLRRRREGDVAFFFRPDGLLSLGPAVRQCQTPAMLEDLRAQAAKLERGTLRFFSCWEAEVGEPLQWLRNPLNGQSWPRDRHWSRVSLFQPGLGDVKLVWEASRFAQCFALVRAFAVTGDEKAIALALRRMVSWIDDNPPAYGPLWACGQEASLRIMAWCFALFAAAGTSILDEQTFATIAASIYRHGRRIEAHIGFARSIRNNHSLSEAAGLYTIGTLFPEFDRSGRWRSMGRRILVADARRLFFDDGAFVQHSMNYHRVALHLCTWAARLGQLHGQAFPAHFVERVGRAARFLRRMLDDASGRVPNYGSNDGALVLPLSGCDYLDHRPALQSAAYLCTGRRLLPAGPWDEEMLWLFGAEALGAPDQRVPAQSSAFETGGYYTLRGRASWGMVRCHTYFERPGEADMLHLDLWWRGENILRDAGSYSYFCPPPWDRYFKSTSAHNTIEVDGLDQMTKGPRFLWHDWTRSRVIGRGSNSADDCEWWEGEHHGYRRRCGVVHRRRVERRGDSHWRVVDQVFGEGPHTARLFWRLGDWPYDWFGEKCQVESMSPVGNVTIGVFVEGDVTLKSRVVRGFEDAESAQGWESLYYGEKSPIPVLCVEASGRCPIRFETCIELTPS